MNHDKGVGIEISAYPKIKLKPNPFPKRTDKCKIVLSLLHLPISVS
jgi:hypothetical protein